MYTMPVNNALERFSLVLNIRTMRENLRIINRSINHMLYSCNKALYKSTCGYMKPALGKNG